MAVEKTRIYPINTGWLEADLGTYIFWKGKAGEKVWTPTLCFYVDTGEHKLMVDTGLSDAARATKYHHKCEKRGCVEAPEALRRMGVDPAEIEIVIFTHLHWDHVQNMKEFKNARYVCTDTELLFAHNPLPLYYRSYESPVLGIEAPFIGCNFELVPMGREIEIVPGVSVFPTPGHCPGHQAVTVKTAVGNIVIVGDAFFQWRNMEPNMEEKWRYWVPARFFNSVEGWKSIEEIDMRADFTMPTHEAGLLEHDVYPYEGMPLRERRKPVPGTSFFLSGIRP